MLSSPALDTYKRLHCSALSMTTLICAVSCTTRASPVAGIGLVNSAAELLALMSACERNSVGSPLYDLTHYSFWELAGAFLKDKMLSSWKIRFGLIIHCTYKDPCHIFMRLRVKISSQRTCLHRR
jgi:hypothetical protein